MAANLIPYAVSFAKVNAAIGSGDTKLLKAMVKKFGDQFEDIDLAIGEREDEDRPKLTAKQRAEAKKLERSLETDLKRVRQGKEPRKGSIAEELMGGIQQMVQEALGENFVERLMGHYGVQITGEGKVRKIPRQPIELEQDEDDAEGRAHTSMKEALRHVIMGENCDRRVPDKYARALEFLCEYFGQRTQDDTSTRYEYIRRIDKGLKAAGVPARTLCIEKHLIQRGSPIKVGNIRDLGSIGYLTLSEIQAAHEAIGKAKLNAIKDDEVGESIKEVQGWLARSVKSKRDLISFYS